MKNSFKLPLENLRTYIENENYNGYDPYDTLNSVLPIKKMGISLSAVAIQIQKRNPINIRPILGVKKGINPKGMGLLLKSYSIIYAITNDIVYRNKADEIFNWLRDNYSAGYSGYCWGYNFDWASPGSYLKKYTPSVVVTAFVIDGILEYFKITESPKAREIILKSCDFILKNLPRYEDENGICIAYTPQSKDCCYNASLLGAETLAKAYWLTNKKKYLDIARNAVDFVLSKQKDDGCWYYSYDLQTNSERKQIDFHQGFVLISLSNYVKYSTDDRCKIKEAITKGLKFYYKSQFKQTGQSLWRLPKEYPIDIHNQAQGIITFSELSESDEKYLKFSKQILHWTIKNMQDIKGYFYYRKYKLYTNKISYMRWSQAWMFLAMATLLKNSQKNK